MEREGQSDQTVSNLAQAVGDLAGLQVHDPEARRFPRGAGAAPGGGLHVAAGDVRAVAAGQLAGVPRVAADGGPPLMALRARSCRRRRRRCRGRPRSGARALPAAHAACAAPCPDRWACSMSSARPRYQQDTHHVQSPAVGDVADGGAQLSGSRACRKVADGSQDDRTVSGCTPLTAWS